MAENLAHGLFCERGKSRGGKTGAVAKIFVCPTEYKKDTQIFTGILYLRLSQPASGFHLEDIPGEGVPVAGPEGDLKGDRGPGGDDAPRRHGPTPLL